MSADNGIYILKTIDTMKQVSPGHFKNTFGEGTVAYRVAYFSGIDSLEWFEKNQPYNVGFFLNTVWGNSKLYYDEKEAIAFAHELEALFDYLEYGVCHIDRTQYCFPGF